MTSPAAPRTYIDPTALLEINDPSVGDPPPLTYAEITGRVLIAVTDRPDDPDRYPDLITPDGGRIIFTPVMTQTMASNEALIALTPKVGAFDTNGFVISPDGMPGIWLIDLGDPTLNPNVPRDQGSYRVSFENITAGGVPLRLASFAIHPVAGQENDLGVIAPVIPGQGEPMVVGPPGPATTLVVSGTVTGAPGSAADVTISGDPPDQALAFTIPRGDVGPGGPTGPAGPGIPAPGLAVFATNLVGRPSPTDTFPWTISGTTGSPAPQVIFINDPDMGSFARFTVTGITAATFLQIGVAAVTGPCVMSSFRRNSGPAPLTVWLSMSQGGTSAPQTVPNDGVWRRYWHVGNGTGVAGTLRPVHFQVAGSTSGTIDVARASLTVGSALLDYFDGNSPGARWTSAAGNSPSELVSTRQGDIQGLIAARTPLELTGTGMPEGVVTAPVGSSYTDTAATNGAIRWIKATGAGATGWRVLWGDTGNRTLTPLLINGWTASSVIIRRINHTVTLQFTALNPAAATLDTFMADLGVGWRGSISQPTIPVAATGTPTSMARFLAATAAAGFQIVNRSAPAGQNYAGTFLWTTIDTWPATLP